MPLGGNKSGLKCSLGATAVAAGGGGVAVKVVAHMHVQATTRANKRHQNNVQELIN